MRFLIVALGSVGQSIAERLSNLAVGDLEERIAYAFVNTDRVRKAHLSGRSSVIDCQSAVVVPIKPLLGEMYDPSSSQDTYESDEPPKRFTQLCLTEMLETESEKIANALSMSIKKGGLRQLEREVDKALYVDTQTTGKLRVVFVGAACDPLVVGGATVLVDHLAAYVQERYQQSINRMLLLLLSTDAIADAFPRKADRVKLRGREAKLFEAMGVHVAKEEDRYVQTAGTDNMETGTLISNEVRVNETLRANLAGTYVIPATNANGSRLASSEDYCLLAAGVLLAELGGVWEKSLFEDGLTCGHGIALVEYPMVPIEDYVMLSLTHDAISWWNRVDDLWLAGGWEDFGLSNNERGRFFRDEVRRLSQLTRPSEIASCMRHLDEALMSAELRDATNKSSQSAATEHEIALVALNVLVDLAKKRVDDWETEDAIVALGHPLPVLRKLPQTVEGVREAASTFRTDEALTRQWSASLNALERRLGCVEDLEAHISSEVDALLAGRDFELCSIGLPVYLEALHPIAVRSVLYTVVEEVSAAERQSQERAAHLRRRITTILSDDADLDTALDGVQSLKDVIAADGFGAVGADDLAYESEKDRYDAWIARLAGMGYLLNLAALRTRELERAIAESVVLAKTGAYLVALSRQYERFFDGVRRLECRLEDEMSVAKVELSNRRGSIHKLIGTESDHLAEMVETCKSRIEGYPVQHVSWKPINASLRIQAQGPLLAWRQRAASRLVHTEDADTELLRTVLQGSSQGPDVLGAPVHKLCDIDVLSELGLTAASRQQKDQQCVMTGILEEAHAAAEPFCSGIVSGNIRDTLVAGRRMDEMSLRNGFAPNSCTVIGGMDRHRLMVCREALPRQLCEGEKGR